MRPVRVLTLTLSSVIMLASAPALAQTTQPGFNLSRFEPSERGSDWFALESLDLRGNMRPAVGVVGDYGYKPLVLYNNEGDERAAIVRHTFLAHVGASLVLKDRLRLALSFPIAIAQSGDDATATVGGAVTRFNAPSGASAGDLRIGADVRLFGVYRDPITAAFGVQVWAPTGSRDHYLSDGKVRVQPHLLAAGDLGPFTYSARVGVNIRPQTEPVAGSPMGSELAFGAAAGVRALDNKLVLGPELYGATVFTESDAFFKKRTTPFEVLLGAHYSPAQDWKLGAGVGPGITRGFGAPELRAVVSIEYFPAIQPPPPPVADRDLDGVMDPEDACPDQPGLRTDDPKTHGCPPADRDQDGVLDAQDACPDQAGIATQDPLTNGCPPPPPDADGDGVIDAEDACPNQAGIATQDPATNGCPPPPPDRDNDSILDAEDACPDVAGPRDPDPKKNGCPAARVEQGQIKIIQQVKFETGKATILPASDAILTAVADILKKHPEIKKLSVEGHTDNKGVPIANKLLSKNRATAVVAWLVKNGIEKDRLDAAGFGQERAIDTNDTEEGRQNNRRVEFHIRDTGTPGATSPDADKPAAPPPAAKPHAAPHAKPKGAPGPHKKGPPTTAKPKPPAPGKGKAAPPAKKK